ncbi:MAG: hypothetical protein ACP5XB_08860 [Isosphaeraceae bacterium]
MVANRYIVPAALVLLIVVACVGYAMMHHAVPEPTATPTWRLAPLPDSPYLNTKPGVAYVGDEVCARCHAEIAEHYRGSPMGRSLTEPPGPEPKAEGVVFKAGDLAYSIVRRDGRVYHRETRQDAQGRTLASTEGYVRYVLGSARLGCAFLIERGDGLYQSPISWYTQGQRWDLAPAYGLRNLHFDRPIRSGCLFCHSNRVEFSAGQPPKFHGLAIGCERCHGPGELHAREPKVAGGLDPTIVNPARLKPRSLREAVCEQCHFIGTYRVNVPGRTEFEYRPGLPFDAFMTVSPALADPMAKRRIVGHFEQMRLSRCYQESKAELGCISCHDSHRIPPAEERVGYYQSRCLQCHAERGCSLPLDQRLAQKPDNDCTACHMPKDPTIGTSHTGVTAHSIPRNPPATPHTPLQAGTSNGANQPSS